MEMTTVSFHTKRSQLIIQERNDFNMAKEFKEIFTANQAEALEQVNTNKTNILSVSDRVTALELEQTDNIFGYHVNPNESDPYEAVTYVSNARGKTPAKMGASTFNYGSWENAFFLPKPCVLKFDGTVDYYLNPNDYT